MGILKIEQKPNSKGRLIIFQCDLCNKQYCKAYKKRFLSTKTGFFCSCACSGKWKLNHGITQDNLFSQTNRARATEKIRKTYKNNYQQIVAKISETYQEKYGVDNISKCDETKRKKQKTCIEKFGYAYAAQNPDIKQKMISTFIKKYGSTHPLLNPDIKQKALETMKKKGVVHSESKIESKFFQTLKNLFGDENVEQHVLFNNWNIDFYIRSYDVYIQFDGVYWHGLDRPYDIIAQIKNRRDTYILKTIERDRKQNQWFVQNNKILVRITDKIFKKYILNNIKDVQTCHDSLKTQISRAKTLTFITFGDENGILTRRY